MAARKNETRSRPKYAAPALEKGLDILELISMESAPMSLAQVGQRLGRTSGEIFRMLAALERRGYLARGPRPEQYVLTNKLFELAHRHPPTKRLLALALPVMEDLAREIQQSCHLAVRHEDDALIVAQVDCPGFTGFAVRVGAHAPLAESCSGRILLAFQPPEVRASWLGADGGDSKGGGLEARGLDAALADLRERGYNRMESRVHAGIIDFGVPVLDHEGRALAALTVPSLPLLHAALGESDLIARVREAGQRLSAALGAPEVQPA